MPIVVSYTDLEALGSLAHSAGLMSGRNDRQARDAQNALAQRQMRNEEHRSVREGVQQQQMHSRELEVRRAADEQRLMVEMAQIGARSQEAAAGREASFQRQQMGQDRLDARQSQVHQDRVEIEQMRGQRPSASRAGQPPAFNTSGGQTPAYAREEVRKHADALPFNHDSFRAETAAGRRGDVNDTAESLSSMSTRQLKQYIQSRPNDPYAPFVQRVLSDREQRQRAPSPFGVQDDNVFGSPINPTGAASTTGINQDSLRQMTDEDLMRLLDSM